MRPLFMWNILLAFITLFSSAIVCLPISQSSDFAGDGKLTQFLEHLKVI